MKTKFNCRESLERLCLQIKKMIKGEKTTYKIKKLLKFVMRKQIIIAGLLLGLFIQIISAYDSISVDNNIPETNGCDKNIMPDDLYDDFTDAINTVLESGVMDDVDKQIKNKTNTNKKVPIEIYLVDEEEFKEEYSNDVDDIYPEKSKTDLEKEAVNIFENNTGYTYTTDTVKNGVQVVKIKFFCKDDLRTSTIDNTESSGYKLYDLIIHELVHAKLYSIMILNGTKPFEDHDDKFYKEIERLKEKLIGEIKKKEEDSRRTSQEQTSIDIDKLVNAYNNNSDVSPWIVKTMLNNERINIFITKENGTSNSIPETISFNLETRKGQIIEYSEGPGSKPTMNLYISEENFKNLMNSQNPGSTFISLYSNGDIIIKEISLMTKIKFGIGKLLMRFFT